MTRQITKDSTSISVELYIIDATNGTPELGVVFNEAGIDLNYRRDGAVVTSITEIDLTSPALTDPWESGGFLEIANGRYRLDVPNAAFATGVSQVTIGGTITGMVVLPVTIQLTGMDLDDDQIGGMTNLATKDDVAGIANVGAASAEPTVAAPGGFTLTTGLNEQNDSDATHAAEGTEHQWDDNGGSMEGRYLFDIGGAFVPAGAGLTLLGRLNGAPSDSVLIKVNLGTIASPSWVTRGVLLRQALTTNLTHTFVLFTTDIMTGVDAGKVQIQVVDDGGVTGATFSADQMFVSKTSIASLVGYANGSIWVDTNASNENTVPFIDGVADNPVSTWAAALTLSASVGLQRFEIANGSSITLTGDSSNYTLVGQNWTLDINGQIISNAYFRGADVVNGTALGTEAHFDCCHINDMSIAAGHFTTCGLLGDVILTGAGDYFFDSCHSGVAGTNTPSIDFEAAAETKNVNLRDYSGGIEIKNFGNVGTHLMSLEGNGQLVINASCAGGTVAMRGNFTVTDNASAAVTLSDDARYDVGQINDEVDTALADVGLTAAFFAGITSLAQWLGLLAGKQVGNATARTEIRATGAGSGTFDETVDSQEGAIDAISANNLAIGIVQARIGVYSGLGADNVLGDLTAIKGTGFVKDTDSLVNLATPAQVNAEVVDALNVDTYAEPGQGKPAATASIVAKLGYLFKAWRNKTTQTASEYDLFNDDAATVDQKATVSDDATTATKGEIASGP